LVQVHGILTECMRLHIDFLLRLALDIVVFTWTGYNQRCGRLWLGHSVDGSGRVMKNAPTDNSDWVGCAFRAIMSIGQLGARTLPLIRTGPKNLLRQKCYVIVPCGGVMVPHQMFWAHRLSPGPVVLLFYESDDWWPTHQTFWHGIRVSNCPTDNIVIYGSIFMTRPNPSQIEKVRPNPTEVAPSSPLTKFWQRGSGRVL